MFETVGNSNYHPIADDLLSLIYATGAISHVLNLGGQLNGDKAYLSVFDVDCEICREGIFAQDKRLDVVGSILVARYLQQAGSAPFADNWLPYRDLKDGSQFSTHIKVHIEDKIAELFSGNMKVLKAKLVAIGAKSYQGEISADLALIVRPLPLVPVLCLFDDFDGEFPSSFRFLFDLSAPSYLDLESLAASLQFIYQSILGEP